MNPTQINPISQQTRVSALFDQRWASYALIGSAAFLCPGTANAAIINVTPGINLFSSSTDGLLSQNWDVDGDGTDDFVLNADGTPGSRFTSITPLGQNAVLQSGSSLAWGLSSNQLISGGFKASNWGTSSRNFLFDNQSVGKKKTFDFIDGTWSNDLNASSFAGLRFQIAGNDHYGWAKVSTQLGSASLAVTEGAYESTPGQGINTGATSPVGEVPEPSSMALMLLGAAGIAALKLRRNRSN